LHIETTFGKRQRVGMKCTFLTRQKNGLLFFPSHCQPLHNLDNNISSFHQTSQLPTKPPNPSLHFGIHHSSPSKKLHHVSLAELVLLPLQPRRTPPHIDLRTRSRNAPTPNQRRPPKRRQPHAQARDTMPVLQPRHALNDKRLLLGLRLPPQHQVPPILDLGPHSHVLTRGTIPSAASLYVKYLAVDWRQ
jgi:hypothetical protein